MKEHGGDDDRADFERGVVVLDDTRVVAGIGDKLRTFRLGDLADQAFAHFKGLGFEDGLEELCAGGKFGAETFRKFALRREQAFDGDSFERVVVALFEDAGTHRAGAENCGMDDALKHSGTVAALSDCLDHVVHELNDDLLLLLQKLLLVFDDFDVSTLTSVE